MVLQKCGRKLLLYLCLFTAGFALAVTGSPVSDSSLPATSSIQLDLSAHFNAKAASTGLQDPLADFDGSGRAYPVEWLPNTPSFLYDGIEFTLPPFHTPTAKDSIRSNSQVISIPATSNDITFHSFHALVASVWSAGGSAQARDGSLLFQFEDGESATNDILVGPWWSTNPFNGVINTPYHYANSTLDNETIDHNVTSIGYVSACIPNDKPLKSITLPASGSYINFFSISLVPSSLAPEVQPEENSTTNVNGPRLSVQNVRSTTKWFSDNESTTGGTADRIQLVEVTLTNLSPLHSSAKSWITTPHFISLVSSEVETTIPGRVIRLRSNDQVIAKVGVRNVVGIGVGRKVKVGIKIEQEIQDGSLKEVAAEGGGSEFEIVAGIPQWVDGDESLGTHEAPEWYDDAKFGIFVHWGVYSVPAWAPTGLQYAEWYNWQLHNPPNAGSPTWAHHLQTYGSDVVYDDFIANFTASAWDPDDWTDLFSDAGAKYFVLVTKHHDGFALFDTGNSSHRNSLLLGPKRDFLKELFMSAKSRHPELHRGTYFSLPEWFNPAYAPDGQVNFPGGPALNAFNGSCCDPYTGYIPVDNFIEDVQRPQMETLLYEYETDILWCDIGGRSAFPQVGASWYNYAASQDRQVIMNNRCGANQSDFVTPEYATFPAPLAQKWESSAGMDPHSYGYNSDTPPDAYQNASSIIVELIDIVSKGGNFLLDIGPKADGTVIPEMTNPLRQVGQWLKVAGESIYGTRPWFVQPADTSANSTNVRFTTKSDAFYIIAISKPTGGFVQTTAPVPIAKGDEVKLLGGSGRELSWSLNGDLLRIEVGDEELGLLPLPAWAFKIYSGAIDEYTTGYWFRNADYFSDAQPPDGAVLDTLTI